MPPARPRPPPAPLAPPQSPEGGERRASARAQLQVDVSCDAESRFFVGLTGDLSSGGLFVATWRAFPRGTAIELELSLPDGALKALGRVCWARAAAEGAVPGIGIAFERLADEDRARIEAFCISEPPWYYDVDDTT